MGKVKYWLDSGSSPYRFGHKKIEVPLSMLRCSMRYTHIRLTSTEWMLTQNPTNFTSLENRPDNHSAINNFLKTLYLLLIVLPKGLTQHQTTPFSCILNALSCVAHSISPLGRTPSTVKCCLTFRRVFPLLCILCYMCVC